MSDLANRAKEGVKLIEEAISDLLRSNPNGLTNGEITEQLGLESDQTGEQRNYLAWSVLGRMMKNKKVHRTTSTDDKRPLYKLT